MCGINASGAQWHGHISISCYTHLKLELLLHKTVLVMFLLASTVTLMDKFLSMLWKLDWDHFMRSLIILKAHCKIIARLNSSQSQAHMSLLNIPQKSIKALSWINYECFMWHLQQDTNSFWPDCLFLLFAYTLWRVK